MPGPIHALVSGIGKGIGMAQEYNANKKQSKSPGPSDQSSSRDLAQSHSDASEDAKLHPHISEDDPPPEYHSDPEDEEFDAEDWELDDAQRELETAQPSKTFEALVGEDGVDVDEVLNAYFAKYTSVPNRAQLQPLPCPVILPQRRPQNNTRGFVHAYAPVLQGSGINQDEWMDFLNGFHKAVKMSPVFHAVNGAVGLAALGITIAAGPMVVVHFTALAIHLSIEASRRGYTRYSTNKYLDSMNERLFRPRGLYCMIMTYKPDSDHAAEEIDVNTNTVRAVAKRAGGGYNKLSSSSGKTRGDGALPAAAPLVFPELDKLPSDGNFFKKGGAYLKDYMDRKAQIDFELKNPNSKLSVTPKPQFQNKFLDPTHPMNDGSIVALVTGGKVAGRKTRRARRRGEIDPATGMAKPRQRRGPLGTVKRQLKENVLYLTVVNLPSDEELAQANEDLKKAHLFDIN